MHFIIVFLILVFIVIFSLIFMLVFIVIISLVVLTVQCCGNSLFKFFFLNDLRPGPGFSKAS